MLFRDLSDETRLVPPLVASLVALLVISVLKVTVHSVSLENATTGVGFALWHALLLGASLPAVWKLLTRQRAGRSLLFLLPLNALPLFFAQVEAMQLLAGVTVVASLAVYVLASEKHQHSQQLL